MPAWPVLLHAVSVSHVVASLRGILGDALRVPEGRDDRTAAAPHALDAPLPLVKLPGQVLAVRWLLSARGHQGAKPLRRLLYLDVSSLVCALRLM